MERWITVTTVSTLAQADQLCAFLASHGIETFLPDQGFASADPFMAGFVTGIRIQVREDDLEKAGSLLGVMNEKEERSGLVCPHCGSSSVGRKPVSMLTWTVVLLLMGIPLLWWKETFRCQVCGYTWKTEMSLFR